MNQEPNSQSGRRPGRRNTSSKSGGSGARVPRAVMVPNNKEKKPPHCGEGSAKKALLEEDPKEVREDLSKELKGMISEELKATMSNGDPGGGGKEVLSILEKQNSLIQRQRDDIEDLRTKLEENAKLADVFKSELEDIRKKVQDAPPLTNGHVVANGDEGGSKDEGLLKSKIDSLTAAYNDIQDRLYEIDKSWKNNLVMYGIPAESGNEEDPAVTEEKVRDVLHKKLHISREIPISRMSRLWHGPDFRGHKPIQLCFASYRDKEEILRKARLLKGSNIYVSEDFSRKVREHRHELIKFMKEVRGRDPDRRMTLRYDKLYMGHDVFFFNDRSGRVERMHNSLDTAGAATVANAIMESSAGPHDPSWLRRPRSRTHSRGPTPPPSAGPHHSHHLPSLSRQNSLSMDEINSPAARRRRRHHAPRSAAFSGSTTNLRASASARRQRANLMSSSVGGDSFDYESDNNASTASPPILASPTKSFYSRDHERESNPPSSVTSSPTKTRKTVAFTGVPDHDDKEDEVVQVVVANGVSTSNPPSEANGRGEEEQVAVTAEQASSALVPYQKHEMVPASNNGRHHGNEHISSVASNINLPPIPNGVDYATPRHFPMHYDKYSEDGSNLPAILQNSLSKLEMNFVQGKSGAQEVEVYNAHSLELSREFKDREMKELEGPRQYKQIEGPKNYEIDARNQHAANHQQNNYHHQNGGSNLLKQANGVLKVAMYGEFPISSVATATTVSHSSSSNINSNNFNNVNNMSNGDVVYNGGGGGSNAVARTNHSTQLQKQ